MLKITVVEKKPDSSLVITTMETQKLKKKPKKELYRKIHYKLIVFVFIQVCWYFTFSIAITPLTGGNPIFPVQNDDIMNRTARLIMIYHSVAVPFLVANTFWIMEFFHVREKYVPALKVTLIPGGILVGVFGMLFAYTRYRVFHEIFYFGLFLVFMGGILYVMAAFPIPYKFPDYEENKGVPHVRGLNMENISLVILAVCILVSVIYGALAAIENFTGDITGLGREPVAFLAEEIVRDEHDWVQDFIVSHLHIQLAQSTAMVVMIGFKTSKLKGNLYKLVLLFNPIGIIVISVGAWILNHYQIWVGAGILLICTLIMTIYGWYNVSKDHLGEDFQRASILKKIKGIFADPLRFGLYYLYFLSNFTVTIAGIIAGLQTELVLRSHEYVIVEYSFNVGHWHMLSVLIGLILFLIAMDYYDVQGKGRHITGVGVIIGFTISFVAADIYMLRSPVAMELIYPWVVIIGVVIMFLSVVYGMVLLTKKVMEDRKEMLAIKRLPA